MIPENIIQKLKPKQGHYSIDVKESFIDKQHRLSEIERQTVLQKKHQEMQLFKQTFSSSSSKWSKPGKRIMIRTKGCSNQAIPLEQYQQSISTPLQTPTSNNIARKHYQSLSQLQPRLESENNQPIRKEPEYQMNTQQDKLNQVEPNMLTEQIDQMQMQSSEEDNNNDHIQCMVEQHLSDYQAFVMHLAGKCICVQCPCGKCKCKFEYQPFKPNISWKSHYNQEFKQTPIKDQELKMNLDSIGRYQTLDLNEFKTTMASDYRRHCYLFMNIMNLNLIFINMLNIIAFIFILIMNRIKYHNFNIKIYNRKMILYKLNTTSRLLYVYKNLFLIELNRYYHNFNILSKSINYLVIYLLQQLIKYYYILKQILIKQLYKQFDAFPNNIIEKQKYQATYGSTPMTSYNKFYMDYGDLHHEQFKQKHYKTVIPELKFNSTTTYGSEFRSLKQADTTTQKPPNGKPFPTIDLFLGQSQNKLVHGIKMPEKSYQVKNFQEPIQNIPAFENQFMSMTKKDFVMKEVPCIRNQFSQQIQQQQY